MSLVTSCRPSHLTLVKLRTAITYISQVIRDDHGRFRKYKMEAHQRHLGSKCWSAIYIFSSADGGGIFKGERSGPCQSLYKHGNVVLLANTIMVFAGESLPLECFKLYVPHLSGITYSKQIWNLQIYGVWLPEKWHRRYVII